MNILNWNEVQIFAFFFIFIRLTTFTFFLPILGDKGIPNVVKILFGLALTTVTFPVLWSSGIRIDPKTFDSTAKMAAIIGSEAAFGLLTSFVARWIFDAVHFAGNFIGTSIGFSMASVLDPHSETQNIAIAEVLYIMAALFFLCLNGHHLYLSAVVSSFQAMPVGKIVLADRAPEMVAYLLRMTAEVFILGMKLSAPVLIVILMTNLTFSLVARAVSQMNILVLSFIANLIVGFGVLVITLPGFSNMLEGAFESYGGELLKFMRLFGG